METVVVQWEEHFLGAKFFGLPEITAINDLLERAKSGLAFYGETKRLAGEKLKQLTTLSHFDQLICLLQVFQILAKSEEVIALKTRPIASVAVLKAQRRLHIIYHFIETHYHETINVGEVAKLSHLTTAAFCRYFKKSTHLTFTDFLNQYRINQAKNCCYKIKPLAKPVMKAVSRTFPI